MAVQVKDLELQQDAARRAIATKEQQLKPLDAQVKDRNRHAPPVALCACAFGTLA